MNLREEILREHSKAQTMRIANWIGNDPKRFARLATLFLEGEYRITQRAAWVISHCADSYPNLIIPHLGDFLGLAENPPHVAVKRNVLRVMTLIKIPEDLEGNAYDLCYSLARQSKEDVAVRCHAMTILTTLALKYPELKVEVCDIISSLRDHDSPGLRSRSKKLTKMLSC